MQHAWQSKRLRDRSACRGVTVLAAAVLLAATISSATAQSSATKLFENAELRYRVSLPAACRHEEGPGTLDAVCSPDLDSEKSATADSANGLVLEVAAERFPEEASLTVADVAQRYTEGQFKDELPEAVCGEADKARVKIGSVQQVPGDARVTYTAEVTCPEIKFLGLGERGAMAHYVITPGFRYRLMARALKDDFDERRPAIDAFFASFAPLPAEAKNQ